MKRILLNHAVVESLRALRDVTQICDESGRILGTFHPVIEDAPNRIVDEPLLSRDELERRVAEPGGRSLQDILEDFRRKYPPQ